MMSTSNMLMLSVALTVCCLGAAVADEGKDESGKGKDRYYLEKDWKDKKHRDVEKDWKDDGRGSYFHEHGYTRLDIPPGHYPPPGECRIWYPDRPAGHQPPPGKCYRLRTKVPPGAWLIRHPEDNAEHVHVIVYDDYRRGAIRVIGEFDIGTGVFVDIVVDR
ncbi:hypothetical protein [Methylocaldum sp.]|uniref:hypothetical protein n=1 Tax=Methylocaldum sp. TaxID=1969727 RepID=UPI002D301961|nr:hypothetical protein [Methylocaldum sp.]HYE34055.1 hypothetical protein [Methylocaldum sp.]